MLKDEGCLFENDLQLSEPRKKTFRRVRKVRDLESKRRGVGEEKRQERKEGRRKQGSEFLQRTEGTKYKCMKSEISLSVS